MLSEGKKTDWNMMYEKNLLSIKKQLPTHQNTKNCRLVLTISLKFRIWNLKIPGI